jgi:hypothetical protein
MKIITPICLLASLLLAASAFAGETNNAVAVPTLEYLGAINWTNLEKSEFETRAEFRERIAEDFKKFIGKEVWLHVDRDSTFFKYDAETRTASVGMLVDYGDGHDSTRPDSAVILMKDWDHGPPITHKDCRLQIENLDDLPERLRYDKLFLGLSFVIDSKVVRPMAENKKLEIWIKIKASHPEAASAGLYFGGDDGKTFKTYSYQLPCRLLAMRVVAGTTSEILANWDENEK